MQIPASSTAATAAPSPCSASKLNLSGLSAILNAARIKNGIPGMSVAVMYKGELIYSEGFGKRNEHQPFTKETISPIGSLTKAFTCTAIGELVAEGKMDWDETPVNKYLPEFELKDPILTSQLTLADMLSHRTGLSPAVGLAWMRSRVPRRELITRLRHADMPRKLTGKSNYSNVMYAVAGEAAANVAGTSYEQLVHDKVINPLGLASNTGFSQSAMKKLPNHASPYSADSFAQAQKGEFREAPYDDIYMAVSPAGDLHSNVLELVKWGKVIIDGGMLDGKQVLNKENVQMTLTPQSIARQEKTPLFSHAYTYGLGWGLVTYKGHNCYTHSGSYPGAGANLTLFPDNDLVIALLANIQPTGFLHYAKLFIVDKVLDLPVDQDWLFDKAVENATKEYEDIAGEREGKQLPTRMEGRPSTLPREELVGEFKNPLYGTITIVSTPAVSVVDGEEEKEKGEEGLEIQYNEFRNKLEHYHFETFRTVLEDLNTREARLICFETGADGRVSGLGITFEETEMVRFVKVKTPDVATAVTEK